MEKTCLLQVIFTYIYISGCPLLEGMGGVLPPTSQKFVDPPHPAPGKIPPVESSPPKVNSSTPIK